MWVVSAWSFLLGEKSFITNNNNNNNNECLFYLSFWFREKKYLYKLMFLKQNPVFVLNSSHLETANIHLKVLHFMSSTNAL